MTSIFVEIEAALHDALAPADGLDESLTRVASGKGMPISPWAVWLLFCLIRHQRRQEWVGEIAATRLGVDLEFISRAGSLGHPDIEPMGLVPGLTEWKYHLHGSGCQLTHRISGESIDVDFHEGAADCFDVYFFINFLDSLKAPGFCEKRLITLHPTLETVSLAFDELQEAGLLIRHDGRSGTRLDPRCRAWLEGIDRLGDRESESVRVGAAIGDWLLVEMYAPSNEAIATRALQLIQQRRQILTNLLADPDDRRLAVIALVDLGDTPGRTALERALCGPLDGTVSASLKIICERQNEDWCDAIDKVLRRTNPNGEIPEPHVWLTCARYLVSRGKNAAEVRRGLLSMKTRELGDAAILALEFYPELARELFRRALRSKVPIDRTIAAACLAILDQPWCHAELVAMLEASDNQLATAECRAALQSSRNTDLHAVVQDWEARNPHEAEIGPFITMEEMALRTCNSFLQYQMQQLHDQVFPLRSVCPPSLSAKRWWQFWR